MISSNLQHLATALSLIMIKSLTAQVVKFQSSVFDMAAWIPNATTEAALNSLHCAILCGSNPECQSHFFDKGHLSCHTSSGPLNVSSSIAITEQIGFIKLGLDAEAPPESQCRLEAEALGYQESENVKGMMLYNNFEPEVGYNQTQAIQICDDLGGGHLAIFRNQTEFEAILNHLTEDYDWYWMGFQPVEENFFCNTGSDDRKCEGNDFEFIGDGSRMEWTSQDTGEWKVYVRFASATCLAMTKVTNNNYNSYITEYSCNYIDARPFCQINC